jgi:hypothetical protein
MTGLAQTLDTLLKRSENIIKSDFGYSVDLTNKYMFTLDENNQFHSYDDEPAIYYLDNSIKIWMKHGKLHRDDYAKKPTIHIKDIVRLYYQNNLYCGKSHGGGNDPPLMKYDFAYGKHIKYYNTNYINDIIIILGCFNKNIHYVDFINKIVCTPRITINNDIYKYIYSNNKIIINDDIINKYKDYINFSYKNYVTTLKSKRDQLLKLIDAEPLIKIAYNLNSDSKFDKNYLKNIFETILSEKYLIDYIKWNILWDFSSNICIHYCTNNKGLVFNNKITDYSENVGDNTLYKLNICIDNKDYNIEFNKNNITQIFDDFKNIKNIHSVIYHYIINYNDYAINNKFLNIHDGLFTNNLDFKINYTTDRRQNYILKLYKCTTCNFEHIITCNQGKYISICNYRNIKIIDDNIIICDNCNQKI